LTPTIEEYAQILNFSNDPHKVYFRQRVENTAVEITRSLHLDQGVGNINGKHLWNISVGDCGMGGNFFATLGKIPTARFRL